MEEASRNRMEPAPFGHLEARGWKVHRGSGASPGACDTPERASRPSRPVDGGRRSD